jgi:2-polyprenyl-3-methyl-5-hydroxy-6-metoxy-1,4-benzoquinol methylase
MSEKEWFEEWFDTRYYHILYQNRNEEEAEIFISNLSEYLELPAGSKVLDLACGKGRHSFTLNRLGYEVLGVDLSENSIQEAKKSSTSNLSFAVHDMRELVPNTTFDAVFNLFTSFGYFTEKGDNERVCLAISQMLRPGGKLVIDFMNADKVIQSLIESETKTLDGILFRINRKYNGSHVVKRIQIEDRGEMYEYSERVQALKLDDLRALLVPYFEIDAVFGSFDLNPFVLEKSDRLIIIASRKL